MDQLESDPVPLHRLLEDHHGGDSLALDLA
jgi:hypothetical protein